MDRFSRLRTWVFDLDNTLYPPAMRLFDQIEAKMTAFVMETLSVSHKAADELRHRYWMDHGTTLAGLMTHYGVEPERYLTEVHDISFDALTPDPHLAELIGQLPGRRVVYTNGSAPYAAQVLKARGLEHAFDAIYGVEDADYLPKPHADAFAKVFAKESLDPTQAVMFEDDPRNLAVPHGLGMVTVHVAPTPAPADHIHHHTDDLTGFLDTVRKRTAT
ncbi:pyrimidine 5'-nucleotidase [Sagittula stellata]|uniref:Pyrimidine 5'-nucleotidase n=1 Tax=Sagittula stellata (strain ATCC 700073 / DSM 11524 / E-37) TaxID=388399 RepID=A3JZG4_SAGS3|nr:pyrimidine 5'-nucleotidase [Sagittula stellata]EBA09867.1 pyrimidine 5'-nucleotidase [Sagittula stellata E-37]